MRNNSLISVPVSLHSTQDLYLEIILKKQYQKQDQLRPIIFVYQFDYNSLILLNQQITLHYKLSYQLSKKLRSQNSKKGIWFLLYPKMGYIFQKVLRFYIFLELLLFHIFHREYHTFLSICKKYMQDKVKVLISIKTDIYKFVFYLFYRVLLIFHNIYLCREIRKRESKQLSPLLLILFSQVCNLINILNAYRNFSIYFPSIYQIEGGGNK